MPAPNTPFTLHNEDIIALVPQNYNKENFFMQMKKTHINILGLSVYTVVVSMLINEQCKYV